MLVTGVREPYVGWVKGLEVVVGPSTAHVNALVTPYRQVLAAGGWLFVAAWSIPCIRTALDAPRLTAAEGGRRCGMIVCWGVGAYVLYSCSTAGAQGTWRDWSCMYRLRSPA